MTGAAARRQAVAFDSANDAATHPDAATARPNDAPVEPFASARDPNAAASNPHASPARAGDEARVIGSTVGHQEEAARKPNDETGETKDEPTRHAATVMTTSKSTRRGIASLELVLSMAFVVGRGRRRLPLAPGAAPSAH